MHNTKKHADSFHFRLRVRNRFHRDLALHEEVTIGDMCRSGRYFRKRLTKARTLHEISYDGMTLWVVYNKKTGSPVTAFTPDMMKDPAYTHEEKNQTAAG